MIVVLALSSNPNALKNRIYYIYSFAVRVRANSSALVLAVVTVFCFVALKCSIPPNSLMAYLLELYLVLLSSANAASLYVKKTWSSKVVLSNFKAKYLVLIT
jgi:hypothetical protein